MPEKIQTFLVTVAVNEGRHYLWPNMNTTVLTKIDNQKKYTSVKAGDCPFYNEFFTTLDKLMDKTISISVIKPGGVWRKRQTLGYISLDVATVWFQHDHQFYHKWAILSAPRQDQIGGTRGYLKLDISVLSKGEVPKIPKVLNSDIIETNLLLPHGYSTERQRARFIVDIYRGEHFFRKNSLHEDDAKRSTDAPSALWIEITFSEHQVKTSVMKHCVDPVWNQRLIISELFPPLCQRFKLELYHSEGPRKICRAFSYINLKEISNDEEDGFLPTYGPTFLNFYSQNPLGGFLGTVLMSIKTELSSAPDEIYVDQVAPALPDGSFSRSENIILFATIFSVTTIDRCYKNKQISFRMSCGSSHRRFGANGDMPFTNVSPPLMPVKINKDFYHLPIDEKKPCLYLITCLADFRKGMFCYNLIYKILTELRVRLNGIEEMFQNHGCKISTIDKNEVLYDCLDFLHCSCRKYLDIVQAYNLTNDTNLEQERLRISTREILRICGKLDKLRNSRISKRKLFQKLEKYYNKLDFLLEETEYWPRIYLWMIYGSKKVAYSIVYARDIIYSNLPEQQGIRCGTVQTIFFQNPDIESKTNTTDFISMACKVEISLWMGLMEDFSFCLDVIPEGFKPSGEEIPRALIAEQLHEFQCRGYIFQGRFTPGSDRSGLCDPFVEATVHGQSQSTQTLKKTLSPIWDESLIFESITLYGSTKFIKDSPPMIFLEINDIDACYKSEVVGRAIVIPSVISIGDVYTPPKLLWHQVYSKFNVSAEILAAFEFLEVHEAIPKLKKEGKIIRIPARIKPNLINYRIEILFWGVRNLKKVNMSTINKPKIVIECINTVISSDALANAEKNLNFTNPHKFIECVIPEQQEYAPPLSLKMFECRSFGVNVFCGTHVVPLSKFFYSPISGKERSKKILETKSISLMSLISSIETLDLRNGENKLTEEESKIKMQYGKWFYIKTKPAKVKNTEDYGSTDIRKCSFKKMCEILLFKRFKKVNLKESSSFQKTENEDIEDFDWWTKFYASLDDNSSGGKTSPANRCQLKVYQNELELQPEFGGFTDTLQRFPMYKGKRTGDEMVDEENTAGMFKGSLKIYPWSGEVNFVTASGEPLEKGVFQDFLSNKPLRFVLRVYCVRALSLRPKDLNGKSDPYLRLTFNDKVINDRDNYVPRQVNPVFGKCFQFTGAFPADHTLVVSVYDWDMATVDDLVGETVIDVENRFYTKHRAHCGIAEDYQTSGYCEWRDQQKPSLILEGLCRKWNISLPEYSATSVTVAYKDLAPPTFVSSDDQNYDREVLALYALRCWNEIPVVGCRLVPEHVETRSLYHPNKPGIEQGKLQLWIDILPYSELPIPKQVTITPRKPSSMELRVIIWNTDNIKLDEDDFFTGEKKSDIYVKGWLTSPENAQCTDVHYRSLTGEGNFNWRFIFPFDYLATENKMIVRQKETIFALDETEFKIPCQLTLQIWDNDSFSADDFLGALTMELSRIPRGARNAAQCNLGILEAPAVNLFKTKRTKGWWPFRNGNKDSKETIYTGAVEVELEILTKEDADRSQAGRGRDEPQGLPLPKRPDTSFSWFRNPLKAIKYLLKRNKWKILRFLIFVILALIIFKALYSLPTYSFEEIFKFKI